MQKIKVEFSFLHSFRHACIGPIFNSQSHGTHSMNLFREGAHNGAKQQKGWKKWDGSEGSEETGGSEKRN